MHKLSFLIVIILGLIFASIKDVFAQGAWYDMFSYEHSNVGRNFKMMEVGYVIPYKWIGIGVSAIDLCTTSEDYRFFDADLESKGKYGLLNMLSPTFHFIPLAKKSKYHSVADGQSMNHFHFYLSYCPWSIIRLLDTDHEIQEVKNIFGKGQVLDVGIAYTFNVISFFPFSVQAGYLNMYNPTIDIDSYHFPSHRFEKFYFGINISFGGWDAGDLDVGDKYTVVPFIAEPFESYNYRITMKGDWKDAQSKGTIDAYEEFLRHYPQGELSRQARARLNQLCEQRDWEKAKSANTISAYRQFLSHYSEGQFADEAKSSIVICEKKDWKKAKSANTISAYRQFLSYYPEGQFADEVQLRINNILSSIFQGIKSVGIHVNIDNSIPGNIFPFMRVAKEYLEYAGVNLVEDDIENYDIVIKINGKAWREPWKAWVQPYWPTSRVSGTILVEKQNVAIFDEQFQGESRGSVDVYGTQFTPNWEDEKAFWEPGSFADVMAGIVEKICGVRPKSK